MPRRDGQAGDGSKADGLSQDAFEELRVAHRHVGVVVEISIAPITGLQVRVQNQGVTSTYTARAPTAALFSAAL